MTRILIVEDEFDIRESLTMLLTTLGYEVETAPLINVGRSKLRDGSYDCVLLDMMLPDGSGMEILDEIQADETLSEVAVIIMSAIEPIDRSDAQRRVPFLQKPFSFAALRETLKSLGVTAENG